MFDEPKPTILTASRSKQYRGSTLGWLQASRQSILISCVARLAPFGVQAGLMSYDEMELDRHRRPDGMFVIISLMTFVSIMAIAGIRYRAKQAR